MNLPIFSFRRVTLVSFAMFFLAVLIVFLKIYSYRLNYDLAEREAQYKAKKDDFRVLQSQVLRQKTPEQLLARSQQLNLQFALFEQKPKVPQQNAAQSSGTGRVVDVTSNRTKKSRTR